MTSFSSTSINRSTLLTDLPPELKTNIVKRLHDSIVEEATIRIPPLSREEAEREAARDLAKLNFVNRDLRKVTKQVMSEFPDIGIAATRASMAAMDATRTALAETRSAIQNMTGDNQFRQQFVRLVQSNKHIEVPFSFLSPNEQQIVLEELSRREVTRHLKKVKLELCRVTLDAGPSPKNQGTSAQVPRAYWMPAWMRGMIFKRQTDAEVPQESLFQNFLKTMHAMSRHGNQWLDIDLDLSRTNMNDQGATALAEMLQQCKVTSLKLCNNEIEDEGASAIADALPQSRLTSLEFASCEKIGDAGACAIAGTLPRSKLTSLDLSGNQIKDKGASAIADTLPRSKLTNLDLRFNKIGDTGANAIADALPRSKLTSLNLCYNKIEDAGANAIADALPRSELIILHLNGNAFGFATRDRVTQITRQGPNPPTVYL